MHIQSILITGANRGIGLEFVRQLVELKPAPDYVFAACRNPDNAKELQMIAKQHSNVKILKIDIGDEASYHTALKEVTKDVGDKGLNVLFNNAGTSGSNDRCTFENITAEAMIQTFEVNSIGPLMLTKAFYPLLKKAASISTEEGFSCSRSAVLNMTSGMGSINENTAGRYYAYRCSRASLNMITKSMSIDFKPDHILAVAMNPGWVATRANGAKITPSQSVSALLDVMTNLTENDNGSIISYGKDV